MTRELDELRAHDPDLADVVERVLPRDKRFPEALMELARRLLDGTASPEEEQARQIIAWMRDGNRRQVQHGAAHFSREANFIIRGYLGISPEAMRRAKQQPGEKDDLWRRSALEALFRVMRQRGWRGKDGFEMTTKNGHEASPALFRYLGAAVRRVIARLVAREEIEEDMWREWRAHGLEVPTSICEHEDSLPSEGLEPSDEIVRRGELEEGFAVVDELRATGTDRDKDVIRKLAVGEPVATTPAGRVALQTVQQKARLRRERFRALRSRPGRDGGRSSR